MISFICCSIDPDALIRLRCNLEETLGVSFELIGYDNRETRYGLCKVYNRCAAEARYDLLCFIHEDVAFHTRDWVENSGLLHRLHSPRCGVIGFAGSTLKLREMTAMDAGCGDKRTHYIQRCASGRRLTSIHNPDRTDYSPVVLLDGMCLFVPREVWKAIRFDEEHFPAFHGYDLDFSLAAAAAGYTNYVCNTVMPEHFSEGSFDERWFEMLRDLHRKWQDRLPLSVDSAMTADRLDALNGRARLFFIRILIKKGLLSQAGGFNRIIRCIAESPLSIRSWMLLPTYLKYRIHIALNRSRHV